MLLISKPTISRIWNDGIPDSGKGCSSVVTGMCGQSQENERQGGGDAGSLVCRTLSFMEASVIEAKC